MGGGVSLEGGAVLVSYSFAVGDGGEAGGVAGLVGLDGDCGGLTVSWTASLWVCCVTVLLLLQLTVNRASVAMRAVVNLLYRIS